MPRLPAVALLLLGTLAAAPALADTPADGLAAAEAHAQAKRWPEALGAARSAALDGPADAAGAQAAALYLRALAGDPKGEAPPLPQTLDADLAAFEQRYCAAAPASAELCARLAQVDCDVARLRAEEAVRAGERTADRDAARALYEKGGERYVALWKKHGEAPLRAGKPPTCTRLDEIVYNARKAYQAARLIPRAIELGRLQVDPANRLHTSPLSRRTLYELGGTYQAIGEFSEAASWYERYARESPREEKASEALLDAIVLRLGTGAEREAIADADLYNKLYGSKRPAMTAKIAFAVGAHFIEGERWEEARKRLAGSMALIDKAASLHVRMQAHTLHGRALYKLGKAPEAASEHRLTIQLAAALPREGQRVHTTADQGGFDERALALALTALGESHTYFAEEAARAAEAIKLPPFRGKRDAASISSWVRKDLAPALQKRRAAIEQAEKLYLKVTQIDPFPPPRWVVHGAASVAQMWAKLADEIAGLGGTPAKKGDPLQAAAAEAARASARPRARAAAEACVNLTAKLQVAAPGSPACAAWLSRDDRRAYPPMDEIAPKPRWLGMGSPEREEALPDPRR